MDDTFIKDQISRLEGIVRELEEEKASIDKKLIPAQQELEHWLGIASIRGRSSESNKLSPQSSPSPSLTSSDDYGDKQEIVRKWVKSNLSTASIPTVIVRQIRQDEQVTISLNYVYKLLAEWVEEGWLTRVGKKYRLKATHEGVA